ncbi:MAG TPA: hypothetical protein VJN41_07785 [Alphaproteobacteria bacterium]|nr:hypothetical protein [Alphaproteobacteria bacterium]
MQMIRNFIRCAAHCRVRPSSVLLAALMIGSLGSRVHAEERCYVPYAEFEGVMPHIDLMVCPPSVMGSEAEFCRLGVAGETIYVYRFAIGETEDCLIAVEAYRAADFFAQNGSRYHTE